MALAKYYGSRFLMFYITSELSRGNTLPHFTKASLRGPFFCLAKGSKQGKYLGVPLGMRNAKERWTEEFGTLNSYSIEGMNRIGSLGRILGGIM